MTASFSQEFADVSGEWSVEPESALGPALLKNGHHNEGSRSD